MEQFHDGECEGEVVLLVVADIHEKINNVDHLHHWINSNRVNVDAIVFLGDFVTIEERFDKDSNEEEAVMEGFCSSIISALENIHPRTIYIPGNHDPASMFRDPNDTPVLTATSRNAHRQIVRLAPDLVIAGIGGSVDGVSEAGEVEWEGYPYGGGSDGRRRFTADLKAVLRAPPAAGGAMDIEADGAPGSADAARAGDAVILLSHVGPDGVATAEGVSAGGGRVLAGSSCLRSAVEADAQTGGDGRLLALLHGHTHAGSGVLRLAGAGTGCSTPVVNPGALRDGRFALLRLQRTVVGRSPEHTRPRDRWRCGSIEMRDLGLVDGGAGPSC